MKELLELFLTFAKIGVMTFGGGMAMLPILEREVVQNKHWATEEELVDYFAIGQCTPGIIAVNTATFVGQKRKSAMGGITATLGVVFPSLVIITILAGLITNFAHLAWVQNAFAGIQVCVCVLILNAVLKLLKKSVVDKRTAVIFVIVLLGNMLLSVSPVWFVLLSALSGLPHSVPVLLGWHLHNRQVLFHLTAFHIHQSPTNLLPIRIFLNKDFQSAPSTDVRVSFLFLPFSITFFLMVCPCIYFPAFFLSQGLHNLPLLFPADCK